MRVPSASCHWVLAVLLAACGPDPGTASLDAGQQPDEDAAGADPGPGPEVDCGGAQLVCLGLEVHACAEDRPTDEVIEVCDGSCANGACTAGCGAEGVDKVYVVSDDHRLMRFDPDALPTSGSADAAFLPLGQLDCPAGPSFLGGPATPFSMSVDRGGRAWVLYNSGELFDVSIADASCAATAFQPGQLGFDLFGMGFASNAAGSDEETLFITADTGLGAIALGTIDPITLEVSDVARVGDGSVNPELTGTGAAELWGYFPGDGIEESQVARIHRSAGTIDQGVPLEALPGLPRAWAFAQHRGRFYVFVTYLDDQELFPVDVPAVLVVDPVGGGVVRHETSNVIVGAGVSTCAPSTPVE